MATTKLVNSLKDLSLRRETSFSSFSGADYSFLFYVPVSYTQQQISELQQKVQKDFDQQTATVKALAQANQFVGLQKGTTSQAIEHLRKTQEDASEEANRLGALLQSLKGFVNGQIPIQMNNLQTVSYQIHTSKEPVRALGWRYPKAYTKGPRLIAGSMIAVVGGEHPFMRLLDLQSALFNINNDMSQSNSDYSKYVLNSLDRTSTVVDELPPLNIVIIGHNELGDRAVATLYGVEFINDGSTLSIQDLLTENVLTYVALDIDLFRNTAKGAHNTQSASIKKASGLLDSALADAQRRFRRNFAF